MSRPLDFAVRWTKRHRGITLGAIALLAVLALIQSWESARDASRSAHTSAAVSKQLAQNAKNQASSAKAQATANAAVIGLLITQRDARRLLVDKQRYHAALNSCYRQNVARQGTNRIVTILRTAFAPAEAAQKNGVQQTPLVASLIVSVRKLTTLPIIPCKKVVIDPSIVDTPPRKQRK